MSEGNEIEQSETSRLAEFLRSLRTEGRAVVSAEPLGGSAGDVGAELALLDSHARAELAFDLPPLFPEMAAWAARLFYQLSQAVICRDMGEEYIAAFCAAPCPGDRGPRADWSADLTFRHLPRLFDLARHLSNADPLLAHLRRVAVLWPLSSVGIPGLETVAVESFMEHRGLRRLYLDRVAAEGDSSRLASPWVAAILRAEIGPHPELCPEVSAKLSSIA